MKKVTCAIVAVLISALTGSLANAEEKAKEVTISGLDNMQYDVKAFEVNAGEAVKITFKNSGKLPKQVMGHNLVVLKKGTDPLSWASKGIAAGLANNYIVDAQKVEILHQTPILGPGEEAILEFEAPKEAGEYPYVCTFPGHAALMKGVMTVK